MGRHPGGGERHREAGAAVLVGDRAPARGARAGPLDQPAQRLPVRGGLPAGEPLDERRPGARALEVRQRHPDGGVADRTAGRPRAGAGHRAANGGRAYSLPLGPSPRRSPARGPDFAGSGNGPDQYVLTAYPKTGPSTGLVDFTSSPFVGSPMGPGRTPPGRHRAASRSSLRALGETVVPRRRRQPRARTAIAAAASRW